LLPEDVDVAAASPEELRRLVAGLLGEVVRLRDENAALREEIARLKGYKGRSKLKPCRTGDRPARRLPPSLQAGGQARSGTSPIDRPGRRTWRRSGSPASR
jgi:hypothetical protein